jgi:hypothetical protein
MNSDEIERLNAISSMRQQEMAYRFIEFSLILRSFGICSTCKCPLSDFMLNNEKDCCTVERILNK